MREIFIEESGEHTPFEHVYERRANYYETDQMGIIHHSNYIRWFEEARLDYMEAIGISYSQIEAMGIIIPVLSAACQYKTMVRYNDTVEIYTKITRFSGVKMTVVYRVVDKATGELRCTGETSHGFLDRDYKPVRMKRDWPELYELLTGQVAEE